MRLAGVLFLAFVVPVLAGALAYAAVSLLPDGDDAAGRGLGEAFRALLIAVYVILGVVFYGVAVLRRNRERGLKRALLVLVLTPFMIVVLGMVNNGVHRIDWPRELLGAAQMFAPLWVVALTQWLVLHVYLSRQCARAQAASA